MLELGSIGALDITQRRVCLDNPARHQVVQLGRSQRLPGEGVVSLKCSLQGDTYPDPVCLDICDRMAKCQSSY